MNMSMVISSLKSQLGLYNITLPFTDPVTKDPIPTENVIRDVIVNTTIPRFSQFVPWIRQGDINIQDLEVIDRKRGIYKIPKFLTTTEIQYVSDVSLPFHNSRGTYGDVSPAYGINRSVQGVITSTEYMMLAGLMRAEPTFEYLGHNLIKLYGYPKCVVTFKVACNHEPNGETIEDSCFDSFMQLATIDLKEFLYNNLKYYDELPTAFGGAKLKIEEWQNMESQREDLLEKWRDTYHLDQLDWIEFM